MKPVLIIYATRHGHARRIAEHLAAELRVSDAAVEVFDARSRPAIDFDSYSSGIVVASVHMGKHESEMVSFVKDHRVDLERLPCAFLSISLSEAGAEDPKATPTQRLVAHANVERLMATFFEQTGWKPAATKPVAGALLYTRYNVFVRFVMKLIAAKAGASTDTAQDHDLTDWAALDRFVEVFLERVPLNVEKKPNPYLDRNNTEES